MPQWAATIIAALVGAFIGTLGAVWLRHRLDRDRALEVARAGLACRHLYQLQDAVESLWHRFKNVGEEGGQLVMSDPYFDMTSLYSLGRVLACERLLALSGVYAELERSTAGLGETLRESQLITRLRGHGFHHYERLALAEALIDRDCREPRTRTYLDFRARYEQQDSQLRDWLKPAVEFVHKIARERGTLREFNAHLHDIASTLAEHTGVATSVPASGSTSVT